MTAETAFRQTIRDHRESLRRRPNEASRRREIEDAFPGFLAHIAALNRVLKSEFGDNGALEITQFNVSRDDANIVLSVRPHSGAQVPASLTVSFYAGRSTLSLRPRGKLTSFKSGDSAGAMECLSACVFAHVEHASPRVWGVPS